MIYVAKCNARCKYYQVYIASNNKVKVVCAIRGYEIKDIKEKMPNIYNDCEKFVLSK
jgi:hypothetical protein